MNIKKNKCKYNLSFFFLDDKFHWLLDKFHQILKNNHIYRGKNTYFNLLTIICILISNFFGGQIVAQIDSSEVQLKATLDTTIIGSEFYFNNLIKLGDYYADNNYTKLDSLAEVIIEQSKKFKRLDYQVLGLVRKSIFLQINNKNIEALEILREANEISERINKPHIKIVVLEELGYLYYITDNYKVAIDKLQELLRLGEENLQFKEKIGALVYLSYCYTSLASNQNKQTELYSEYLNSVNKFIEEANAVATSFEDEGFLNYVNYARGVVDFELGAYQKVIDNYTQLVAPNRIEFSTNEQIITFYYHIGEAYFYLKEFQQAKNNLDTAAQLALKHEYINLLSEIYKLKSEVAIEKENYKDALSYFKKGQLLKDSLWNHEQQQKFNELSIAFETEKKEKTNQLLEKEKENLQLSNNLISYLSVFLFGGLLLISFFWYRNKKQNQIIVQQKEALEQLDQNKSQFFTNISHELRTPLSLVMGPLRDVLTKDNLPSSTANNLQLIYSNTQRLNTLVEEILDLSRLDTQKLSVEETITPFVTFIKNLVASFESYAIYRSIHLAFDSQLEEEIYCLIDQKKLEKIINNLLSNALKFTPNEHSIKVFVGAEKQNLLIKIEDTGTGIHPEDLPHIFDRFYQAKDNQTTGGLGIGLALCQEYAQLMKGHLTVESNSLQRKGSSFRLTIPRKEVTATIDLISNKASIIQSPISKSVAVNPKKTAYSILVVEDDLELAKYVGNIFADRYTIWYGDNGEKALQQLSERKIDLIISDIMMPQMNGFELLEAVRKKEEWQQKPFIFLTARTDITDKLKGLRLGVDDYLIKPFYSEELLARVENLLGHYEGRKNAQLPEVSPVINLTAESTLSVNEAWINELEKQVLTNIENTDFNVPMLASLLLISETTLRSRIKTTVGLTPNGYIKEVRLLKAKSLLENKRFSRVSEVCYAVGLSQPSYFAKLYKQRFGKLPSEYFK